MSAAHGRRSSRFAHAELQGWRFAARAGASRICWLRGLPSSDRAPRRGCCVLVRRANKSGTCRGGRRRSGGAAPGCIRHAHGRYTPFKEGVITRSCKSWSGAELMVPGAELLGPGAGGIFWVSRAGLPLRKVYLCRDLRPAKPAQGLLRVHTDAHAGRRRNPRLVCARTAHAQLRAEFSRGQRNARRRR